jgi:hypothetical protein
LFNFSTLQKSTESELSDELCFILFQKRAKPKNWRLRFFPPLKVLLFGSNDGKLFSRFKYKVFLPLFHNENLFSTHSYIVFLGFGFICEDLDKLIIILFRRLYQIIYLIINL